MVPGSPKKSPTLEIPKKNHRIYHLNHLNLHDFGWTVLALSFDHKTGNQPPQKKKTQGGLMVVIFIIHQYKWANWSSPKEP